HPYALSRRPRPCRVERQICSPAKHDEPGAHLTNGFAIVLAEVTNRLVVRNKPARQPHLSFPKIISARISDAVRPRLVCWRSSQIARCVVLAGRLGPTPQAFKRAANLGGGFLLHLRARSTRSVRRLIRNLT